MCSHLTLRQELVEQSMKQRSSWQVAYLRHTKDLKKKIGESGEKAPNWAGQVWRGKERGAALLQDFSPRTFLYFWANLQI